MDEIKELYKMNSYQTPLTEEIKNSVPREVWLELIDFLSSVEFIKRLVAPEDIRGYAKDKPRETKFYNDGRINVDLTNPHILEDMDYFRERAIFYEKHGKYTHLTPNPNPKSEYGLFWKEELRRWKYGLIRPGDGEWIPGQLYFYWNYSPIWLVEIVKTENKGKKQKGERVRKFPKPWLGDYLFYHYMQQARDGGMHGKLLKTRGVGFPQPNSENILTPTGFKKVGDIKLGEYLINRKGEPTKVLEIHKQNLRTIYELEFSDGRKVRSDIDHLWTLEYKNKWVTKSVKDLLKLKLYNNNQDFTRYYYKIPDIKPVNYSKNIELSIKPYLLGFLIGDGNLTKGETNFSTNDIEILDYVKDCIGKYEIKKHVTKYSYGIINPIGNVNYFNREIKNLGLNCKAIHKFIPKNYLLASIEDRIELLKGLMDSDGCISKNGFISYTTSSLELKNNFLELCRSLGIKCSSKETNLYLRNNTFNKVQSWQISLSPNFEIFKLNRKLERQKLKKHSNSNVYLKNIQSLGYVEECTCFTVDNDEHLYLTTDFIPTHNSFKMGAISPCNMFVYPGSGNPNFHLASEKTFLAGDKGIWGKVVDTLDWIAESTPLPRMRTVDRAGSTLEIQLGFKDEYGVRKGLLSSVHGISLKDNPDKARGIRGPLIHYEEDGLFPNLEKAWNVNLKAVEDGDVGFGFMLAGGCLTKNNLVWTNDGRLLPINEITKEDGILGYDGNGIYKEKIGWFKEPQKKPCYKITTSGGDTIECSNDHPLLWSRNHWRKSITKNKVRNNTGKFVTFKNTEEIKIGDQLLLVDEVPIFGDRFVKDARMIGLMIGDGNYSIKATPQLSCGDDEIFEYVKERYNYTIPKQFEKKTGGIYRSLSIPELKPILIEEGIYGQAHLNKKLPKDIHKYNKESLSKLIGGYFDADGDIYYSNKRNNVRVRLTSKSEDLLRDVKYQLVKFGINSKITKEFRKTGYLPNTYIYRLNITSYTDVLRFKENIPLLIEHKNKNLSNILNHSGIDRTRVENGVFQLGGNNKGYFFIGKENMKNMRIESVTNVEFIGEQTIYNLHTTHTNTYIANNFITKQTGGVEGGSFEGSEKLFYNTAAYEIYGISNVFDKNTKGDTTCGFFWGGYLNRNGCYDEECGEPDVIKALLQILTNRYKIKYNSQDPNAITQKKAEEPITPQEAIMRTEGTVFPVSDLKDYLESIMVRKESFLAEHYVGELVRTGDGKLKWRLNNDKFPLRSYDKDNANREGCLEIFEMPSTNANGEIAHGRYIAGIDPIDADSGTSLFSIQVMDLFTDRIVAEFSGRPRLAEEAYEISLRLLEFYNAVANYEKNLKGLFSYFDKKNALFRLCDTPQILKDMQMTKDMGYGNTSKGTMANAEVNKWGRKLQADWMNTSLEDEENPGKLKLHTLRGLAYIEECIKWNSDGNFDRVSAGGMLFILREDRYKRTQSAIANQDKQIETLANDKFFNRNFNKPNAMNGKQIHY